MGRMTDPMVQELQGEAEATRRVLERVPEDRLTWRPHEKSMTLGQLALHVAGTPGNVAEMAMQDQIPMPEFGNNPQPGSRDEVLRTFEESVAKACDLMGSCSDERAGETFRIMSGDQEVMSLPRIAMLRMILLNHWYHHRGQLTVYLRLLDVPVPAVYGASADENLMAAAAPA